MELKTERSGTLLGEAYQDRMLVNDIQSSIRRRNLPFVPELYRLLGMTIQDGVQNFADIILESKHEFEEYNPPIIEMIMDFIPNNHYTFTDTFFDWVDDKLPPSEVIIKPRSIIHMTSMMTSLPSVRASNQWNYDYVSGDFYSMWSNCRLKYYADYPYRCTLNDDSTGFTEDSAVYLISDKDQFINLCSLNVLKRIREYSGLISLSGFSSQLQLDQTISRLEETVQDDRSRSSAMYSKWRNK